MTTRGVYKPNTDLLTSRMLGCFRYDPQLRQEFLALTRLTHPSGFSPSEQADILR
jgi:GTP cyclohydrolase I